MEFRLRLQEFIELVRRDCRLQAVQYARQYLAPWAGQYMKVRYGGTGGEGWQPEAAGSAVRTAVPRPLGRAIHEGTVWRFRGGGVAT